MLILIFYSLYELILRIDELINIWEWMSRINFGYTNLYPITGEYATEFLILHIES